MQTTSTVTRIALICGIVAPLLFVCTDILAGTLYAGYSFLFQSIGELSAVGAPTRSLVVPLNIVYNLLVIVFVLGVWVSAHQNHLLRVTAVMMLGNVVFTLIGAFFPMQPGGAVSTVAVVVGAVSMVFFLLAIGFGAAANRSWFRLFSTGILVVFLVLTILGLMAATSHVGVQERTMAYSYALWQGVLAIVLLRIEKKQMVY